MSNSPPAPPSAPRRSRGRPRKLDETKRRQICALISAGGELQQAAELAGCSTLTIYRETLRDPQFREQFRQAQARGPRRKSNDRHLRGLPPALRNSIRYFERKDWRAEASHAHGRPAPPPAENPKQPHLPGATDSNNSATLTQLAQALHKLVTILRDATPQTASNPHVHRPDPRLPTPHQRLWNRKP